MTKQFLNLFLFMSTQLGFSQIINGIEIDSVSQVGVNVVHASESGLRIQSSGQYGIYLDHSGSGGVLAITTGLPSNLELPPVLQGEKSGFLVAGAEGYGLFAGRTDLDGVYIRSSGGHGVNIYRSDQSGLFVDKAQQHGVHINDAKGFGIFARGTQGAAHFDGRVGVGTLAPARMIHMHENSASTSNFLKITNNFTGETSGDGLDIGVEGTGDAIFWMKENRALKFATSNSVRKTIFNEGKVGIGTISPINNLEVMGAAGNDVAGFTRTDLGGNKSQILHGATL